MSSTTVSIASGRVCVTTTPYPLPRDLSGRSNGLRGCLPAGPVSGSDPPSRLTDGAGGAAGPDRRGPSAIRPATSDTRASRGRNLMSAALDDLRRDFGGDIIEPGAEGYPGASGSILASGRPAYVLRPTNVADVQAAGRSEERRVGE